MPGHDRATLHRMSLSCSVAPCVPRCLNVGEGPVFGRDQTSGTCLLAEQVMDGFEPVLPDGLVTATSVTGPGARMLVMKGYKAGRSVAGPVYLGEDPLRLARPDACGSLLTPRTVTRHNPRGRATDQLDVGHLGATYLAASL